MTKSLFYCLALAAGAAGHPNMTAQAPAHVPAPAGTYPQTWRLVKWTGQTPGAVKTGAALPWQERYVFHADGTFVKTRRHGRRIVAARGTFAVQHLADGAYAVLTYGAASALIGSCAPGTHQETLRLETDATLVSTWQACDGPGLEYQRVK